MLPVAQPSTPETVNGYLLSGAIVKLLDALSQPKPEVSLKLLPAEREGVRRLLFPPEQKHHHSVLTTSARALNLKKLQ